MDSTIFKGATRPPMVMGVPLVPMVVLVLCTVLPLGFASVAQMYWLALLFVFVFLVCFLCMRSVSKHDPWRMKQELQRFKLRKNKGNAAIWGGVSYGPLTFKKR